MREQSRTRERDVMKIAADHAVRIDEENRARHDPGLTKYGLAHAAASLAMVLTDPYHPNHRMLCDHNGLEPRER